MLKPLQCEATCNLLRSDEASGSHGGRVLDHTLTLMHHCAAAAIANAANAAAVYCQQP